VDSQAAAAEMVERAAAVIQATVSA